MADEPGKPGFCQEGGTEIEQVSPPFLNTNANFRGGKIAYFAQNWQEVSRDSWVLETVKRAVMRTIRSVTKAHTTI